MSKVKVHFVENKEKYAIIGEFYEIIANLKSKKEIVDFFVGLLTPSEALMMARRIQIAQMLLEEKSYDVICKKIRVSNQTITRTDRWLHSGDDSYDNWIGKCLKKKKENKCQSVYYTSLLDRYPQHRFLKDLLG